MGNTFSKTVTPELNEPNFTGIQHTANKRSQVATIFEPPFNTESRTSSESLRDMMPYSVLGSGSGTGKYGVY
jgi:hypothetical protein